MVPKGLVRMIKVFKSWELTFEQSEQPFSSALFFVSQLSSVGLGGTSQIGERWGTVCQREKEQFDQGQEASKSIASLENYTVVTTRAYISRGKKSKGLEK